jgi:hypothetical protein
VATRESSGAALAARTLPAESGRLAGARGANGLTGSSAAVQPGFRVVATGTVCSVIR